MVSDAPTVERIANPATSALLDSLSGIGSDVISILRILQQGQDSPPGITKLTAAVFQTSKRYFVQWFVIAGSAAGAYGLRVGTADVFTVQMGAADTKIIPLPITIDNGKEISISLAGGAALVDAFIVATTDEGE